MASMLLPFVASAVCALSCGTGEPADPRGGPVVPPTASTSDDGGASAPETLPRQPHDVVELFTTRMLPTCSLNSGVCHNANNYPDLRNVATIADLVDLPCGRDQALELRDACEPPGDHVVAEGGVDVVVLRATFDLASNTTTITTASDVASGPLTGVAIHRGADEVMDASAAGATFTATAPRTIAVGLAVATDAARVFFEPQLPLREDRIWAADVNGNGIAGATSGWREIVPGRPDKSWLVARLWNAELDPELMPRQCRAWDDGATRALGCWIEQLKTDPRGAPTNFFDPIDYARCKFVVPSPGRCGP
jgi:hypothetical protein